MEPGFEAPKKGILFQVTPLSKYLAMLLFILMPFIGGWIGYVYAPEKVVEVERIVEVEKITNQDPIEHSNELCNPIAQHEFAIGERFKDTFTSLSFIVPETTLSIVTYENCPHPPKASFEPYTTKIFLSGSSTIEIKHDAYFGEWNAGVPLSSSTSTLMRRDSYDATFRIYNTYKWNETDGYSDWEKEGLPFAVLSIKEKRALESDTLILLPYTTDLEKDITDKFISSIERF